MGVGVAVAVLISGLVPPAAAVEPPDGVPGGLQLVKEDLEFILRQIKIAEASPNGKPSMGPGDNQVISELAGTGLRTVTGVHNNLLPDLETVGAADEPFPRLLTPDFRQAGPACTGAPGGGTTSYAQVAGIVCDAQPRTASNLIVDQTTSNPAAVAAAERQGTGADLIDVDGDPATAPTGLFIPNTTTDAGLSARSNAWFTLFGQFFDHGLDLVAKGGNGTVIVPLQPGDPLYQAGSPTNFMVLTRATNVEPGVREHKNLTTPFVDQNQTYTSHPSHQVFLREYVPNGAGDPVATGHLLDAPESAGGGLARWIDVKNQAQDLLGVTLGDTDIFDVPLVLTDLYGKFTPGNDGLVQRVPNQTTGHAFLDDIAHHAVPDNGKTPDANTTMGDDNDPSTYDDETLDAHYITGDGRGNENIGLTAVHHVFHSEHNRVVEQVKSLVNDHIAEDPAFVAEWRLGAGAGGWNGERLFQAARLVTEMEYQHLVFEEFARKITPAIEVLPRNESGYSPIINPAISAEFAHVVYRFGHSMLTENVRRVSANGTSADMSLFDAFLNPMAFTANGTISADQGAGALVRGNIMEVSNEIDEFVTDVLRNRLVGLPLDLATLNMARAREAGVPRLNDARRQFFAQKADSAIEPYSSWNDFGAALRNPESLVNFVAAYGLHPTIVTATTAADKRAAASLVVNGGAGAPDDRAAFMEGSGAWSTTASVGLEDVDFWVGGLAERAGVFGSMLGSTFNRVFQSQLEALQFGDRFYYLSRLNGTNLLGQLENNSFAALISRNTDAANLPADVFAAPDCVIDLSQVGPADPLPAVPASCAGGSLVREASGLIRFQGDNHVLMIGGANEDRIRSGLGDDTIQGSAGADRLEGDDGNDTLIGGDGADYITDVHGDDVIKAGSGSDRINGGPGLDLIFGASGKDYISHGSDATESFGGLHDDFIRGGSGIDVLAGNLGDDWLEGGGATDLVQGDNANTLQNDPVGGDDVLASGGGNDDYDAEGGMDIMLASPGTNRNHGMLGFDWVTHTGSSVPANDDMTLFGDTPLAGAPFADRFDLVEGLSGWEADDILRGDNRSADSPVEQALTGHELTAEKFDKIQNLEMVLGDRDPALGPDETAFTGGNILLGGPGSDLLEGRAGDDVIDGDAWLDVFIRHLPDNRDFPGLAQVEPLIFSGEISPNDLSTIRQVIAYTEPAAGSDTAVFSGVRDEYVITPEGGSRSDMTVQHTVAGGLDGTDRLRNIEYLQFADVTLAMDGVEPNQAPTGNVSISDTSPVEDQVLTVSENIADVDGISGAKTITWTYESVPGTWTTFAVGTSAAMGDQVVGFPVRAEVSFLDGKNKREVVVSGASAPVTNVNDAPVGRPTVNPLAPLMGQPMAADARFITDADGVGEFEFTWEQSAVGGGGFTAISGGTGPTFIPGRAQVDRALRVVARYTDGQGTIEEVASEASDPVTTPPPPPVPPAPPAPPAAAAPGAPSAPQPAGPGAGQAPGGTPVGASYIGTRGGNRWTGTAGPDRAAGGGGNDTLSGLAGDDELLGQAGRDRLDGGEGSDTLTGGSGRDNLLGGPGNDVLRGNSGRDTLNGGTGDDTLVGGSARDAYRFGPGEFGTDTVTGFDANPRGGQERLDIRGLGVTRGNFAGRVTVAYDSAARTTTVTIKGAGGATLGTIILPGVGRTTANSITSADFRF